MNPRFDTAPLYSLGSRRPRDARTVALGWPIWVAQVRITVIGRSRRDELDLFETAVLDLSATGVHGHRALAENLDLDRELVAHVIGELQNRELLDPDAGPTELGLDFLLRKRGEWERQQSGFVLVDAWSGQVLEGLHRTLEPLAVQDQRPGGRDRWPSLLVETARERIRVALVPAHRNAPDVAAAAERPAIDEALSRGEQRVGARSAIRGLNTLGEPWPARVLIWAYRRMAGPSDRGWMLDRDVRVLDPAGGQDAIAFEEELRELRDQPGGEQALALLYPEDEHDGASVREQQRRMLLARLGPLSADHPAVDHLAEALALRAGAHVRGALVELAAALESTLREAATEEEYQRAQTRLASDRHAAPVLEEALSACGFQRESVTRESHLDSRLPLRARIALIVLIAADDRDHPLRELAREEAEDTATRHGSFGPIAWVSELDELAFYRNVSAHGGKAGEQRPTPDPAVFDHWFHLVERATFHLLRNG